MTAVSTGIPTLDRAIGGLLPGDNVVWLAEADDLQSAIEDVFLGWAVSASIPTVFVATTAEGRDRTLPDGVERIDATGASPLAPAARFVDAIQRWLDRHGNSCMVVDDLSPLVRRWGLDETLDVFSRSCPAMLQSGVVTYWRVPRRLGPAAVERIRRITQWLLERRGELVHVLKSESNSLAVQGSAVEVTVADRSLVATRHPSAGRLARGLSALRRDLGLTQTQLAEIAGVTPSAVSQAESGVRGLSVDTLIAISDRLGVTLDRLVNAPLEPGYRLGRHDRIPRSDASDPLGLFTDVTAGLRLQRIRLGPDEAGGPTLHHEGVQLVSVRVGLVLVEVADDTPVLRAGDALLVEHRRIRSWRNLRHEPAVFDWVVRD